MEDAQIIALYWDRDETAVTQTAERYGPYCRTVAGRILPDPGEVEECVNDTWLRAWNAIPPQRPHSLGAFLSKITRNLAFDRLKARGRLRRGGGELILALEELEECVSSTDNVEEEVQQKELERVVRTFLKTLPVRDRDIFLRRYFFVEPVGEIAARCAMRENAVSAVLSRTRKKLRIHLQREGWV